MGDEDHGRARGAAALVDEPGDGALAGQVEREQGLVAQEDRGVAQQGLGDAQPLLLAAREQADRGVGVGGGAHRLRVRRRPRRFVARAWRGSPQRWPSTPKRTRSRPRIGQRAVEGLLLGHVAQRGVAAARRRAVDAHRALGEGDEPEQHLEQGGLARAVGPEHGEELALGHGEVQPGPQGALAQADGGRPQLDGGARRHGLRLDRSAWRRWVSCDCCHCW